MPVSLIAGALFLLAVAGCGPTGAPVPVSSGQGIEREVTLELDLAMDLIESDDDSSTNPTGKAVYHLNRWSEQQPRDDDWYLSLFTPPPGAVWTAQSRMQGPVLEDAAQPQTSSLTLVPN